MRLRQRSRAAISWSSGTSRIGSPAHGCASDGAILDPGGLTLAQPYAPCGGELAVSSDGAGNFLVAYSGDFGSSIRAIRVRSSDGAILDATPIVVTTEPYACNQFGLVFGGGAYLLAWPRISGSIRARRISPQGALLGGELSFGTFASQPAVAYSRNRFVVAWVENEDVRAQRISAVDGSSVGNSVALTQDSARQNFLAASSDGRDFLIAWSDERAGAAGVYGRRMAVIGGRVDRSETPLFLANPGASFGGQPIDLSFDGVNHFVIWSHDAQFGANQVYGRRVSSGLLPLDGPLVGGGLLLSIDPGGTLPSTAFGAGHHLVAWQNSFTAGIRARRVVAADATFADAVESILSTSANWQDRPNLGYGGGTYLVAWNDSRRGPYGTLPTDLVTARVRASDGAILDPNGIVVSEGVEQSRPRAPSVASDGAGFLLAWNEDTGIRAARVAQSGAVLDRPALSFGSGGFFASAGYSSGYYLVAWTTASARLVARRLDPATGALVDAADIPVGGSSPAGPQVTSAIACTSFTCLVVWFGAGATGEFDTWGSRIRMIDGALLDPEPIRIGDLGGGTRPAVATDGLSYVVVFRPSGEIWGRRMDAATGILFPSFPISAPGTDPTSPAISYDGTQFVVVWSDLRTSALREVWTACISPDGTLLDDPYTGGTLVSNTDLDSVDPKIASDGQRSLSAYTRFDPNVPFRNRRIRARFLTPN